MRIILGYFFIFLKPFALRKAKIVYNFGLSECNRVNENLSCDPSVERSRWDSSTRGHNICLYEKMWKESLNNLYYSFLS